MPHMRKVLAATVLFTAMFLGLSAEARADSFVLTLPDYTGPFSSGPFPGAPQTVGTFTFTPPPGQQVVGAVVSGQYGLPGGLLTAPGNLFLDGVLSRECRADTACTNGGTNGVLLSFVISQNDPTAPLNLSNLRDGSLVLTFVQTGPGTVRLSNLQLHIQTAVVPEPTTILLFGTGLLGALKLARRRRKA